MQQMLLQYNDQHYNSREATTLYCKLLEIVSVWGLINSFNELFAEVNGRHSIEKASNYANTHGERLRSCNKTACTVRDPENKTGISRR